jgi:hypothetical protein
MHDYVGGRPAPFGPVLVALRQLRDRDPGPPVHMRQHFLRPTTTPARTPRRLAGIAAWAAREPRWCLRRLLCSRSDALQRASNALRTCACSAINGSSSRSRFSRLLRSSLDSSAIRPRVAAVATRYPGARIARHRRPGLAASRAVNGQLGRSNCPNSRERHANSVNAVTRRRSGIPLICRQNGRFRGYRRIASETRGRFSVGHRCCS